jgi:hypothetical protein
VLDAVCFQGRSYESAVQLSIGRGLHSVRLSFSGCGKYQHEAAAGERVLCYVANRSISCGKYQHEAAAGEPREFTRKRFELVSNATHQMGNNETYAGCGDLACIAHVGCRPSSTKHRSDGNARRRPALSL